MVDYMQACEPAVRKEVYHFQPHRALMLVASGRFSFAKITQDIRTISFQMICRAVTERQASAKQKCPWYGAC